MFLKVINSYNLLIEPSQVFMTTKKRHSFIDRKLEMTLTLSQYRSERFRALDQSVGFQLLKLVKTDSSH